MIMRIQKRNLDCYRSRNIYSRLATFTRDRRGSPAVEFAIIVPVYLMMMFSLFEVGWFYFVNSTVDAAVGDAGRMIRTGQIQKTFPNDPAKQFDAMYDVVCDVVDTFGDCAKTLTVEVQTYNSFADLAADTAAATCANAPPADIAAIPFSPGGEEQIVRARICFLYKSVNPAVGIDLTEQSSDKRRIVSTTIFRNEPYEKNVQTGS